MAGKTGKPPTTKGVNAQKDYMNMFMVGASVVLLFLYTKIVQNKTHWMYLECAIAAVYAVASACLGTFIGEIDSVATYFIRLRAAAFVSHAMATYFTERSLDRTVPIAVSISSLLMRACLVIALECGLYLEKFGESTQFVCWEGLILFFLALGDLYHVMASKTRIYSHRTVGDPVSFHISIDALVSFCFGTFVLGFPDLFLNVITSSPVSSVHLYLVQLWGITLLAGAMLSFASLCYRDDDDAVNTLKAKLIVYLTVEVLAVTHLIVDSSFRTYAHCGLMIGLMGGLAMNAGHILYQHEKDD